MPGSSKIVVVEDEAFQRKFIVECLAQHGLRPTAVASGTELKRLAQHTLPDLALLDVHLNEPEDGFALARWLRSRSTRVGIIMLTAADDMIDRVVGLESGADDYVAKPFEPRELALRIGNILKRTARPPARTLEQVAFGPYVYHLGRGELRQGEEIVHLTDREREMLRILAESPGETVPRGALTGNGSVNERAVDVQINRLRRKIERDPTNPLFLQAVRGIGYRLVASP